MKFDFTSRDAVAQNDHIASQDHTTSKRVSQGVYPHHCVVLPLLTELPLPIKADINDNSASAKR
jgi:hypothetical protein